MTICIAAKCELLGRIIFAADALISNDTSSFEGGVKFNFIINAGAEWVAMFAGHAPEFRSILEQVRGRLKGGTLTDVTEAFEHACATALRKRIEVDLLASYGWTRDEFLATGRVSLGDQRFDRIVDAMEQTSLGIEFLVAGYDALRSARMFHVTDRGYVTRIDQLPFHAVGNGSHAAMSSMLPLGRFCGSSDFQEIVYRVCAAKFAAESVPGVGRETYISWIGADGESGALWPNGVDLLRDQWREQGQPPVPVKAKSTIDEYTIGPDALPPGPPKRRS